MSSSSTSNSNTTESSSYDRSSSKNTSSTTGDEETIYFTPRLEDHDASSDALQTTTPSPNPRITSQRFFAATLVVLVVIGIITIVTMTSGSPPASGRFGKEFAGEEESFEQVVSEPSFRQEKPKTTKLTPSPLEVVKRSSTRRGALYKITPHDGNTRNGTTTTLMLLDSKTIRGSKMTVTIGSVRVSPHNGTITQSSLITTNKQKASTKQSTSLKKSSSNFSITTKVAIATVMSKANVSTNLSSFKQITVSDRQKTTTLSTVFGNKTNVTVLKSTQTTHPSKKNMSTQSSIKTQSTQPLKKVYRFKTTKVISTRNNVTTRKLTTILNKKRSVFDRALTQPLVVGSNIEVKFKTAPKFGTFVLLLNSDVTKKAKKSAAVLFSYTGRNLRPTHLCNNIIDSKFKFFPNKNYTLLLTVFSERELASEVISHDTKQHVGHKICALSKDAKHINNIHIEGNIELYSVFQEVPKRGIVLK